MNFFIDTSAWTKFFLEEDGSTDLRQFLNSPDRKEDYTVVAAVTYAEMLATLKRANHDKRITEVEHTNLVQDFKNQWKRAFVTTVSDELIEKSGNLAEKYFLKGCDSFQLASALIPTIVGRTRCSSYQKRKEFS